MPVSSPRLKHFFVLQWKYIQSKVFMPEYPESLLHKVCDALLKVDNLFQPLQIGFLFDEWNEIVSYAILIAAYHEMIYTDLPHVSNETLRLSTDCFWNADLAYKIIQKYKHYIVSAEIKILVLKVLYLGIDKVCADFLGRKEGILSMQFMKERDTVIAQHVCVIQKVDSNSYRIIETNIRSFIDLRHSLFERTTYGFPYSWTKSASSEEECKRFLNDLLVMYKNNVVEMTVFSQNTSGGVTRG